MNAAIDFTHLNLSWPAVLPLLIVGFGAVVILLNGVNLNEEDSEGLGWLTIAVLGVAFVLSLGLFQRDELTFAGAIALDDYSVFFYLVVLLAAGLTTLMSLDYVRELELPGAEYYSLILFATLGMMLMAAAGDLIIIFLGLETMSISIYVLAGLNR